MYIAFIMHTLQMPNWYQLQTIQSQMLLKTLFLSANNKKERQHRAAACRNSKKEIDWTWLMEGANEGRCKQVNCGQVAATLIIFARGQNRINLKATSVLATVTWGWDGSCEWSPIWSCFDTQILNILPFYAWGWIAANPV